MPCRRGCSVPKPGPVCCCAQRRCSGRHRPRKDGEQFCTADTCSNPEFCVKYRPQFCPNAVAAPPSQENPDGVTAHFGHWSPPPPFPDISTPWAPPYPNHSHPLSITQNPLHSQHAIPSLHSFSTPYPNQNRTYSTQSGNPIRRKSTARLSIGKPSLTRLDSGQNPMQTGVSRPESLCAMGRRLSVIGRPSITHLDGLSCCRTDHSNFGGNYPFPAGAGARYSDLAPRSPQCDGRASQAQPTGRFQLAQQDNGNASGSDRTVREGRCECRMPPAFAPYRCTGNLSGLCCCPHCNDNT